MTDMHTNNETSKETRLDTTIEDLIGKLVEGSATDNDIARLQSLSAARARSMKASVVRHRLFASRLHLKKTA